MSSGSVDVITLALARKYTDKKVSELGETITFTEAPSVDFVVDNVVVETVIGILVNEPESPSKEGYTFSGWEDSDGHIVSFPYEPSGSETLTAKFEVVEV